MQARAVPVLCEQPPSVVAAARERHADVLEWVLFLNSHEEVAFAGFWGDKDTYAAAFALAGKQAEFVHAQPMSLAVTRSEGQVRRAAHIAHVPERWLPSAYGLASCLGGRLVPCLIQSAACGCPEKNGIHPPRRQCPFWCCRASW